MTQDETSWEKVDSWYDDIVGKEGHYYHQHVVIPGVLKLLALPKKASLLDLACGQGILSRAIPKEVTYQGVDLAPSLIKAAKKHSTTPHTTFAVGDICSPLTLPQKFTHASLILAIQNLLAPEKALQQASSALEPKGTLVIVMNHPCFRLPRQSHWGIDPTQKIQYRRIDRYLTPLKIPIQTHPGKQEVSTTWSFHHPLSHYINWLGEADFVVTKMEEWISPKVSTGKYAKMENRARTEFPLFLAIKAEKRYI